MLVGSDGTLLHVLLARTGDGGGGSFGCWFVLFLCLSFVRQYLWSAAILTVPSTFLFPRRSVPQDKIDNFLSSGIGG